MFLAVMLAGSAILLTAFMYASTRADVIATLERDNLSLTSECTELYGTLMSEAAVPRYLAGAPRAAAGQCGLGLGEAQAAPSTSTCSSRAPRVKVLILSRE
jgi:hypothetical protein